MNKKILSLLLSVFLLLSLALPAMAAETEAPEARRIRIVNLKNLEKLAENCRLDSYSENLVVSLEADLDLNGRAFAGIPIFCGRFEGNGHTIRGLYLTKEGSQQGFFRYLTESAVVHDLHLQGEIQPEGSAGNVGGFAGENAGKIRGCSFSGTVSGKEYIGGIAGTNTVTGIIEDCRVSGSVFGGHFVGGMAGQNLGTIRSCENSAAINETSWQNELEFSEMTLDSVFHSEAANTVTDVGGIAGRSSGVIRACTNLANVGYLSMGYNIGGIAGTQSGSILDCENRGEIFGRKEVGGIVGQMEPASVVKFEEDAFQILERQLKGIEQAVNSASSNLEGAGENILRRMGGMYPLIRNAQDAVNTLIPDPEKPELPDQDTLQAARNTIGSSLTGMAEVMEGVGYTAYSALGKVSTNLISITKQIDAMRTTLGNASETLGGSVVDRSDEDTELDLSGKVAGCSNDANIRADMNCGGIAGAIAMENDLDVEEDWQVFGENSLNFESEIRAVIRNCENRGVISVGKQNAGGIVGLQSLGLVKKSLNTGKLDAENADYVGGISGLSLGFIRSSYAKGEIWGDTCLGGIAGSASIATDNYALVHFESGTEKIGAILGKREENQTEEENPISSNYYLAVHKDPGAIDGISYNGQAQPLTEDVFFQLENIPEVFRNVTVTFRYGNGMDRKYTVDFGTSFPKEWIPPIPPKEGRQSYWKGMEAADLSAVFFDRVFEQAYTTQTSVLESPLTRNEIPLLFVQGIFSEDAILDVQQTDSEISLESGEKLLEIWQFRTSEPDRQSRIRLQLPETADPEAIRILIRQSDGTWRTENGHVLGRYAVASLISGDDAIAVVQTGTIPWLPILAAAGLIVLAGIFLIRKRKTKE